ncbi:uncharacterized protein PHALS_00293 [Plasmopara halstedii]|uniref:Uncharacterized protein n=1 Tax=Plasmopara halstedii TaxID=4781 RepID=A0A0P1A6W0_PLAHL|nr:uncharacterized protein PHALS_00293 [Plasmopara halstedii]CEG35970.1 hypothetical protein PHALS_00293 [Plasmopara halstedii]|eukprot:XP_024572339.1 hypothetical protein PHALS_00293 [Plasmopara halstedii]
MLETVGDPALLITKMLPTHAFYAVYKNEAPSTVYQTFQNCFKAGPCANAKLPKTDWHSPGVLFGFAQAVPEFGTSGRGGVGAGAAPTDDRLPRSWTKTGFEHGVQRSPSQTAPVIPPSHEAMHWSYRRLEDAPTECDSPQREVAGAQRDPSYLGLPRSGMQSQHDAQRSPDRDELRIQELEEHRESPDRDLPNRHRLPPTDLNENGGVYKHVERFVGRRRRQGQTQYNVS